MFKYEILTIFNRHNITIHIKFCEYILFIEIYFLIFGVNENVRIWICRSDRNYIRKIQYHNFVIG